MNSRERREARYQRRKAAREKKRLEKIKDALDFDKVVTFGHMYRSALKCFRSVRWKASVQSFKAKCAILVAKRIRELRKGVFRLRKSPEHEIRERGHKRKINSIHIIDRVPQKCLCAYSLKPVLHRSLIYDNYASQERKGTDKARKRLKCMLERHIRRYGLTGGIIVFDFKGFFDSIRHNLVHFVLDRNYDDKRLVGANMKIVRHAREEKGLVLGSENSQDFAISTPSAIDHYIKEKLKASGFGRYMDDGWIMHPDMDGLKVIFHHLKACAERLGFKLNEKKSRIIRFGKPFTMLKRKYSFTETGKIIIRAVRESVIRERRKLKKIFGRFIEGTMRATAGSDSLKAWKASLKGCRCRKITGQMNRLYDSLFIRKWLSEEEEREACITKLQKAARLSTPATGSVT